MFACNLHNQFLYSVIQSCKKKNDNPERKKTFDLSMQSLEKKIQKKSIDHRFLDSDYLLSPSINISYKYI